MIQRDSLDELFDRSRRRLGGDRLLGGDLSRLGGERRRRGGDLRHGAG